MHAAVDVVVYCYVYTDGRVRITHRASMPPPFSNAPSVCVDYAERKAATATAELEELS